MRAYLYLDAGGDRSLSHQMPSDGWGSELEAILMPEKCNNCGLELENGICPYCDGLGKKIKDESL